MISRIDGSSYWQDGKSADGAKSYISAYYQTHQHYPSWKDLQEYMSVSDVQTAVLLKEILDICQLDREAGLYYIGMLGLQCSDQEKTNCLRIINYSSFTGQIKSLLADTLENPPIMMQALDYITTYAEDNAGSYPPLRSLENYFSLNNITKLCAEIKELYKYNKDVGLHYLTALKTGGTLTEAICATIEAFWGYVEKEETEHAKKTAAAEGAKNITTIGTNSLLYPSIEELFSDQDITSLTKKILNIYTINATVGMQYIARLAQRCPFGTGLYQQCLKTLDLLAPAATKSELLQIFTALSVIKPFMAENHKYPSWSDISACFTTSYSEAIYQILDIYKLDKPLGLYLLGIYNEKYSSTAKISAGNAQGATGNYAKNAIDAAMTWSSYAARYASIRADAAEILAAYVTPIKSLTTLNYIKSFIDTNGVYPSWKNISSKISGNINYGMDEILDIYKLDKQIGLYLLSVFNEHYDFTRIINPTNPTGIYNNYAKNRIYAAMNNSGAMATRFASIRADAEEIWNAYVSPPNSYLALKYIKSYMASNKNAFPPATDTTLRGLLPTTSNIVTTMQSFAEFYAIAPAYSVQLIQWLGNNVPHNTTKNACIEIINNLALDASVKLALIDAFSLGSITAQIKQYVPSITGLPLINDTELKLLLTQNDPETIAKAIIAIYNQDAALGKNLMQYLGVYLAESSASTKKLVTDTIAAAGLTTALAGCINTPTDYLMAMNFVYNFTEKNGRLPVFSDFPENTDCYIKSSGSDVPINRIITIYNLDAKMGLYLMQLEGIKKGAPATNLQYIVGQGLSADQITSLKEAYTGEAATTLTYAAADSIAIYNFSINQFKTTGKYPTWEEIKDLFFTATYSSPTNIMYALLDVIGMDKDLGLYLTSLYNDNAPDHFYTDINGKTCDYGINMINNAMTGAFYEARYKSLRESVSLNEVMTAYKNYIFESISIYQYCIKTFKETGLYPTWATIQPLFSTATYGKENESSGTESNTMYAILDVLSMDKDLGLYLVGLYNTCSLHTSEIPANKNQGQYGNYGENTIFAALTGTDPAMLARYETLRQKVTFAEVMTAYTTVKSDGISIYQHCIKTFKDTGLYPTWDDIKTLFNPDTLKRSADVMYALLDVMSMDKNLGLYLVGLYNKVLLAGAAAGGTDDNQCKNAIRAALTGTAAPMSTRYEALRKIATVDEVMAAYTTIESDTIYQYCIKTFNDTDLYPTWDNIKKLFNPDMLARPADVMYAFLDVMSTDKNLGLYLVGLYNKFLLAGTTGAGGTDDNLCKNAIRTALTGTAAAMSTRYKALRQKVTFAEVMTAYTTVASDSISIYQTSVKSLKNTGLLPTWDDIKTLFSPDMLTRSADVMYTLLDVMSMDKNLGLHLVGIYNNFLSHTTPIPAGSDQGADGNYGKNAIRAALTGTAAAMSTRYKALRQKVTLDEVMAAYTNVASLSYSIYQTSIQSLKETGLYPTWDTVSKFFTASTSIIEMVSVLLEVVPMDKDLGLYLVGLFNSYYPASNYAAGGNEAVTTITWAMEHNSPTVAERFAALRASGVATYELLRAYNYNISKSISIYQTSIKSFKETGFYPTWDTVRKLCDKYTSPTEIMYDLLMVVSMDKDLGLYLVGLFNDLLPAGTSGQGGTDGNYGKNAIRTAMENTNAGIAARFEALRASGVTLDELMAAYNNNSSKSISIYQTGIKSFKETGLYPTWDTIFKFFTASTSQTDIMYVLLEVASMDKDLGLYLVGLFNNLVPADKSGQGGATGNYGKNAIKTAMESTDAKIASRFAALRASGVTINELMAAYVNSNLLLAINSFVLSDKRMPILSDAIFKDMLDTALIPTFMNIYLLDPKIGLYLMELAGAAGKNSAANIKLITDSGLGAVAITALKGALNTPSEQTQKYYAIMEYYKTHNNTYPPLSNTLFNDYISVELPEASVALIISLYSIDQNLALYLTERLGSTVIDEAKRSAASDLFTAAGLPTLVKAWNDTSSTIDNYLYLENYFQKNGVYPDFSNTGLQTRLKLTDPVLSTKAIISIYEINPSLGLSLMKMQKIHTANNLTAQTAITSLISAANLSADDITALSSAYNTPSASINTLTYMKSYYSEKGSFPTYNELIPYLGTVSAENAANIINILKEICSFNKEAAVRIAIEINANAPQGAKSAIGAAPLNAELRRVFDNQNLAQCVYDIQNEYNSNPKYPHKNAISRVVTAFVKDIDWGNYFSVSLSDTTKSGEIMSEMIIVYKLNPAVGLELFRLLGFEPDLKKTGATTSFWNQLNNDTTLSPAQKLKLTNAFKKHTY